MAVFAHLWPKATSAASSNRRRINAMHCAANGFDAALMFSATSSVWPTGAAVRPDVGHHCVAKTGGGQRYLSAVRDADKYAVSGPPSLTMAATITKVIVGRTPPVSAGLAAVNSRQYYCCLGQQ